MIRDFLTTFQRNFARITMALGFLSWICGTVLVATVVWFWSQLPSLNQVREGVSFTMVLPGDRKETRHLDPKGTDFIRSKELPRYVVGAILVSEDAGFYQHRGLDLFELREAFYRNLEERKYVRGASTITQQVVKNAFLTREKTLLRKGVEIITALRLERFLTKEQILDYYLNMIELGPGVYGLRAGARYYFKKHPRELTPREAALIAFFIPNPLDYGSAYLQKRESQYREKRVSKILQNMHRQQYMGSVQDSDEEAAAAAEEDEDSEAEKKNSPTELNAEPKEEPLDPAIYPPT